MSFSSYGYDPQGAVGGNYTSVVIAVSTFAHTKRTTSSIIEYVNF
jgi:hypothetical protein